MRARRRSRHTPIAAKDKAARWKATIPTIVGAVTAVERVRGHDPHIRNRTPDCESAPLTRATASARRQPPLGSI
jgi:hypothetical protein